MNVGSSKVWKFWQRPDDDYHRTQIINHQKCDEILVVADNQIAERGSHDELLQKDGIYAHYYHMQA